MPLGGMHFLFRTVLARKEKGIVRKVVILDVSIYNRVFILIFGKNKTQNGEKP